LADKDDLSITLIYEDKKWLLAGKDFESNSEIFPIIEQTFEKGRDGSIAERISTVRKIKNNGLVADISYRCVLGRFDEKIDSIISEINIEPTEPTVNFQPNAEDMFSLNEGKTGIAVDKDLLYSIIDQSFSLSKNIVVQIPTKDVPFTKSGEELLENTKLRSSFSTSYASSQAGRKNNVKLALSEFNGMVIQPEQEASFNEITGDKTPEKGYKKAKIILNGMYVEDYGGGACQSSTTLYNALLLADLEILEVHPHSLPVSYVSLAFDAMVSEGYSDLKFRNNLNFPIYIKTWGDEEKAYVEIYGAPLAPGEEIKRKTEFIEVIPHQGDTIIKDVKGEYSDKITYAGEYLRIKYPQEGYHSKALICYYKDGNLVSQKLIRDEIYQPQRGIVMEGVDKLGEGMFLPENDVKIIPPQSKVSANKNTIDKKLDEQNPSNYNP
jgi:vancomycin resistance protein YoaR